MRFPLFLWSRSRQSDRWILAKSNGFWTTCLIERKKIMNQVELKLEKTKNSKNNIFCQYWQTWTFPIGAARNELAKKKLAPPLFFLASPADAAAICEQVKSACLVRLRGSLHANDSSSLLDEPKDLSGYSDAKYQVLLGPEFTQLG